MTTTRRSNNTVQPSAPPYEENVCYGGQDYPLVQAVLLAPTTTTTTTASKVYMATAVGDMKAPKVVLPVDENLSSK
jgi:hypothetical protein